MTQQNNNMFGMDSIDDYLGFCAQTVAEFEQDQANVRRAFAAILALNHIPDWLQYKLSVDQRLALGQVDSQIGQRVKDHFENQNGDLKLVRKIANGFKHLSPNPPSQVVGGYGSGPFRVGPYGAPYLLIDLGEEVNGQDRWLVALALCKRTLDWWNCQLAALLSSNGENIHE